MALQGTKALQKWCEIVTEGYEGVKVLNMTTSWRSGLGFCAIIHHFRPDILDFESLDPEDVFGNNQLAFAKAEQHLGIPALLDPQDMVECELLDRLSILTYLSQFFQAFHGATAPSAATTKPMRISSARSVVGQGGGSPIKMPVIGKRNEPCKICNQPVFILERLNVTGKLLHRTCFKCARCQTQLNVLNYYETENGNYCCDMCPDEEKNFSQVVQANKKIAEEHLDSGLEDSTDSEREDRGFAKGSRHGLDDEGNEKETNAAAKSVVNDNESTGDTLEQQPTADGNANCLVQANTSKEEKEPKDPGVQEDEAATAVTNTESEIEKKAVIDFVIKKEETPEIERAASSNPFGEDDTDDDQSAKKEEDMSESLADEEPERLYPDLSKEAPALPELVVTKITEDDIDAKVVTEDDVPDSNNDENAGLREPPTKSDATEATLDKSDEAETKSDTAEELPVEPETEQSNSSDLSEKEATEKNVATEPTSSKESEEKEQNVEEKYPDDLNPFGDDEDEDVPADPKKLENDLKNAELKKESTNPFGSDFEDDDNQENVAFGANKNVSTPSSAPVLTGPPKPPRAASLNPFGSDFEDDDEELNISTASSSSFLRSPASPSVSVRSRKKRPAPKPPGASPSPVPSPRSSKRLSAAPVPTPRSSRPAPPRPKSPTLSIMSSASTATLGRARPPRPPPPAASGGSAELPKDRKEKDNLNRRSQALMERPESLPTVGEIQKNTNPRIVLSPLSPDKAVVEGQWKKKKGPAPPRPIPQKRQVKKLPRKAVNTELHDIEIKQQELERQGVRLERNIRELCERGDRERSEQGLDNNDRDSLGPEVEDLIVQLFDLVNEKNDLFRRQTELMYMKKDHRLEEEYADTEHQIRMLMDGKPEAQKTAEDSAKEEQLITRLMELVAQRNEIVDCLEMDRLREKEEDESFEIHMGEYAAIKPVDEAQQEKKKKKEKKKEKKKRKKDKNFDADKDIDTSEFPSPKPSPKKEKGLSSQSDKDKAKKLRKKIFSTLSVTSMKKT